MSYAVIGYMAVLRIESNADELALKTLAVLLLFERITDKMATPMMAVKITITPFTSCPILHPYI